MHNLFREPGEKLKTLAVIFLCAGGLISVCVAIIFFFDGKLLWGALFLAAGPILSWALSLPVYGFGVLIERITRMERLARYGHSNGSYQK